MYMPISVDEYERGHTRNSIAGQILDFLEAHPNNAFQNSEIMCGIGISSNYNNTDHMLEYGGKFAWDFLGLMCVEKSLDELEEDGLIEKDEIDGNTYYRAK